MNAKTEAINNIIELLRRKRRELYHKKQGNKNQINRLAYEQTVLKKEIAKIDKLLRGLNAKTPAGSGR